MTGAVPRRQPGGKASGLPLLYSVDDVASQLGVSPKTVRRWIAAKELPVYRVGRQLRISESDLVAFIAHSRCP
jgi:excisionase family DNA binding protein